MKDRDIEMEANIFAVCLLIPDFLLIPEIEKGLDLGDDKDLKRLCKMFDVTPAMLTLRMAILKKTGKIK